MDASLRRECSAPEVPLQVEASGGTEASYSISRQGTSGVLEVPPTGVSSVEPVQIVEAPPLDGNSIMPVHESKGSTDEEFRVVRASIIGNLVMPILQNSSNGNDETVKKEHVLSLKKCSIENGAETECELRNGSNSVVKDIPPKSQVPMRKLARKSALLKSETTPAPKTEISVADAVKEGILKKEREEQERKEAVDAVMEIHGVRKQVTGHAVPFPGVAGPESGRLCHCCSRPESSKSTIFCDKCERGFHVDCVKHWPKPAQELDVWHCGPCGLQPGHYWPLGRVLISYDNAVAEYKKYSSNFLTTLQRKDESSFGIFSQGMGQKTHESSDGLEGVAKVKVIRDFKKEARKGNSKVSKAVTSSVPVVSKAGPGTPMHVKELGSMAGIEASGDSLPQTKPPGYPGFVPIQPKTVLSSIAPIVNFMVSPEANAVKMSTSSNVPIPAIHQSRSSLPFNEFIVSSTPGFLLTGSISSNMAESKVLYPMSKDSTGPAVLSSKIEIAPVRSQHQETPVTDQFAASPKPNLLGSSLLSSVPNQISALQKTSPASGAVSIEVSSTEKLRPFAVGERLTEREELLKEAKDSLNQLRTFITALKGNLADDWRVILRKRPTGAQEKFYLSPAKRKYRSRQDVARFLGLVDDPKCQRTKSSNLGTSLDKVVDKNNSHRPASQAPAVINLPMFCGDVMIEKLGVIDSRATYSDEHHIWPVGFRSSWHDPETRSYCISEVEDGGELGPIFRVTRKLVIVPANGNNDLSATLSLKEAALDTSGIPVEPKKVKICDDKPSSNEIKPEVVSIKVGDNSVFQAPTEGNQLGAQKQRTEVFNKHASKFRGSIEAGSEKEGVSLIEEVREGKICIMNSDPSSASPMKQILDSPSIGQSIIDLTEEKEFALKPHSETILDIKLSASDVKNDPSTIDATKGACASENAKANHHHSEPPPVVIELSDEEDEKPSSLVFRDEVSAAAREDVGKASGFPLPHIKPLPNILMEELSVEARRPSEAWKAFGKKFVEQCKKFLGSGLSCTVPILEATNDYVIYNSGTSTLWDGSTDIANAALLSQKSVDGSETTKALFYDRLEKRLGEDRFGLNLPVVQNMIKSLRNGKPAGYDKVWTKGVDQNVEVAHTASLSSPSQIKETAVTPSDPWKKRKRKKNSDWIAEGNVKKGKPLSAELAAPHPHILRAGEQFGIEKVAYRNLPPVSSAPAPLLASAIGLGQATGSIMAAAAAAAAAPVPVPAPAPPPPPVIIIEEPRLPPPDGEPILKRLPSELVGDLLQVWEFLCRFSDLFGQDVHFTLEDLEAGLLDVGPVREVEMTTEGKDCSNLSSKKKTVSTEMDSSELNVKTEREGVEKVLELSESFEKDLIKGDKVLNNSTSTADRSHESTTVADLGQDSNAVMETVEVAEKNEKPLEDLKLEEKESKNLIASEGDQSEMKNAVEAYKGTLSKGLAFLAEAHIPLLKFLVSDLKFRISRGLNEDEGEEPKKRGRKRVCDVGPLPPEFGDDLPMNAVTWPEVAHRYLVAILDVKKHGEVTELAPDERKKLMRYFEGDGGVMGGAVEGVIGVESDAQVLAEAEKELTLRMPKAVEKDIVIFVPQEWDVALTPINPAPKKAKNRKTGDLDPLPKWVEALEPVRKMPTNLGTKLKLQVQEALDYEPPDWAKATLEWSLSKGTFKSNAAGTTKRAVLEVLAQYHGEELKAINAPRVRKVKAAPSAEHLMQRCRIVLREVAKADSKQVFGNLVGGASAAKSNKDAGTLSRPLDFRTIDARLAAGAYGGSTDAFAADMRQIWKNVESVQKNGSVILELATTLSQLFEKLYLKQVVSLIKGMPDIKDDKEKVSDVDTKVDGSVRSSSKVGTKSSGNAADDKLGKAPWEDDTTCRVCGIDEDYDSILLCDGCDAEYHIYCLVPPLEKVPKGNWFCPSCVAVEEGFPEAPSLGEAELAEMQEEMERPVAGSILKLEYEDEKVLSIVPEKKPEAEKMEKELRSGTMAGLVVDGETLNEEPGAQLPAEEISVEALLNKLEEKEYWQLSLSDKLFLLKFLCDEALKTPQARAHLEKSVEVALELQQQLRDLVAERLKIVVPMDVIGPTKSVDKDNLQKPQTNPLSGPSLDTTQLKDVLGAVVRASGLEQQSIGVADAPKLNKATSPASNSDDDVLVVGECSSMSKPQENNAGVGKVAHDLDLNVEAGKEPESDYLRSDHNASFGTNPVELKKGRLLVKGSESTKPVELDVVTASHTEYTVDGNLNQLLPDQKLGLLQDSEQRASERHCRARESDSGHIHMASVTEGVEDDVPIQPDTASRPSNPLKRSLVLGESSLPSTSLNGPENVKRAKKDENLIQSTPSGVHDTETNDLIKEPSDAQAAASKILEDKDARIRALQSARELDMKITKLGSKLFNLSLRREHMGTDHLGREYWALTGVDGRPCLVVADSSAPQDGADQGANSGSCSQTGEPQGIEDRTTSPSTVPSVSKGSSEDKEKDVSDFKAMQERTKWVHYRGDKALDELVKWLSPRDQHERVLRISIYHWRRSLYPRHLLDMPEIKTAVTTTESSKIVDEPLAIKETSLAEEMEEISHIRSFPAVNARRLLLRRHTALSTSRRSDLVHLKESHSSKEIQDKKGSVLRRCECLELLWDSRHHCLTCHETYESSAEFQTHSNDCPLGSKPSTEIGSKETPALMPTKAKKVTHESRKLAVKMKKLTSFDKASEVSQSVPKVGITTRSERLRRGLKRESLQPTVDDDVDMDPAESMEFLPKDVVSQQIQKISSTGGRDSIVHTPTGLSKALEGLLNPSSSTVLPHVSEQPVEPAQVPRLEADTFETNFTVDDFDANSSPSQFGVRIEKRISDSNLLHESKVLNTNRLNLNCSNIRLNGQGSAGLWVDDLNISNSGARETDLNADQLNRSDNLHINQGNSGGWVNDLNISDKQDRDQESNLPQSNCSNISRNPEGNNGGWMNDLNISSHSFSEQVVDSNNLKYASTPQGGRGNSGGWANDLNVSTQAFREDASSFGYHSPAPALISTPGSARERASEIGFLNRGPSFASPVQSHLAFDSSLVVGSSPAYPTMESFNSLETLNPVASQYQQFLSSRNTLCHAPLSNSNFLLSLNDTNSKSVPYNQYLAPLDHANSQQLSFQQLLSSNDSLSTSPSSYPNSLPSPENANTTPLSHSNRIYSRDSRNPQPVLYSQGVVPPENLNFDSTNKLPALSFPNLRYINQSSAPYVDLNPNFSQPGSRPGDLNVHSNPALYGNLSPNANPSNSRHSGLNMNSSPLYTNFSTNSHPSASHHTDSSINPNPSLTTNLNISNPHVSLCSHLSLSNNLVDSETKKFEMGRFKSNSWFDSQSAPKPSTVERPPVIPTKPTARRSSTWDYLINLPLSSSQGSERPVQKQHESSGRHLSPSPIEVGSLPFDLMFDKPQREDLNESTVPEDYGTLTLDRMFDGQQVQSQTKNSCRDAVSMGVDSATLDLMLEKQEQEHGLIRGTTAPSELGALSIDLMTVPEEIAQADTMDIAEGRCTNVVQVEPVDAAKETCSGNVPDGCIGAPKESSAVAMPAVSLGDDKLACKDDAQVEGHGEAGADRVEAEPGEVNTSSEQRILLSPPVPVAGTSSARKPVKRFPVANASVHPLVGEQKYLLRGLQISLLDMEAAMVNDILESARASPVRRRAWRTFVKSSSCIYEVMKAIILLELMVKADCLKPSWGYWSSFSAAARSSSLSSLALRLFALDSSISYEWVKAAGDGKETSLPSKNSKAKKKKPSELPLPPPPPPPPMQKKKKKKKKKK